MRIHGGVRTSTYMYIYIYINQSGVEHLSVFDYLQFVRFGGVTLAPSPLDFRVCVWTWVLIMMMMMRGSVADVWQVMQSFSLPLTASVTKKNEKKGRQTVCQALETTSLMGSCLQFS